MNMNMNAKNKSRWLEMKIVELSYRGHNYREISDKLQVSLGKVSNVLNKLNLEAREEIKGWIDFKTPFEYTKSFLLLQYLLKKSIEICEATKDERVQLEAMARLADIDAQKRQLLSDSFVINQAISSLQKQRKHEIIIQQQQQQQHAAATTTTTLSKPTHEKIKRQHQHPEKPKQLKLDSDADSKSTTTTHEPPEESNG